jgi:hypothetical protein
MRGLEGEIGNLSAMVAEAETRISGLAIESLRLQDRRREDAITRLRDLGFSRIELQERRLSLRERIARLDVKAPVSASCSRPRGGGAVRRAGPPSR